MATGIHARGKTTATPASGVPPVPTGLLQRKCACGGTPSLSGECEECNKKRLTIQCQAEPSTVPPVVHEVLRSPGQPLDSTTRALMEPRFGHDFGRVRVHDSLPRTGPADLTVGSANDVYEQEADRVARHVMRTPRSGSPEHRTVGSGYDFSGVRVHSDARAAESARAINALAYTVGQDVVLGAGQYAPDTSAGQQLLAHELTHVVQQSGRTNGSPMLQRQGDPDAGRGQVGTLPPLNIPGAGITLFPGPLRLQSLLGQRLPVPASLRLTNALGTGPGPSFVADISQQTLMLHLLQSIDLSASTRPGTPPGLEGDPATQARISLLNPTMTFDTATGALRGWGTLVGHLSWV